MKILIVEDDSSVAQVLTEILLNQNYAVETIADGKSALDLIQIYDYDLIILDVNLPELDGLSVCRRVRKKGKQMPILLLTGCASSHEKAVGLDAGADDYLVKPFEHEELVARIRALLRRSGSLSQPILNWGELHLDPTSCEVTYGAEILSLTPKEYGLLELFLRNTRRVFSCGMILEHLWSYEDTPGEEAVRTHIKGLRQKLKAAGAPANLIETVYGIGYRLKPLHEENSSPSKSQHHSANPSKANNSQKSPEVLEAKIDRAIAAIWQRNQPHFQEQLSQLAQAADAIAQKKLTPELRSVARQSAHSLAGSLGTFGMANGSTLARQIETLLQSDRLSKREHADVSTYLEQLQAELDQHHRNINQQLDNSTSPISPDNCSIVMVLSANSNNGSGKLVEYLQKIPSPTENCSEVATIKVNSLDAARRGLYQQHPHVIVVDTNISNDENELCSFLNECDARKPAVPAIIIGDARETEGLMHCLPNGRHRLLERSAVNQASISQAVQEMLQVSATAEANVLIVDDDASLGEAVRALLRPWGLNVTVLTQVDKFWETLERVAPDLLILDVEIPDKNGVEICQEVRDRPYWSELPIMFLTVHNDAETVNRVFSVGADDFICKPIIGPELVTRIVNRLERVKIWRNLADTDPLTKLVNRHKAKQELEKLLSLSRRYGHSLCLIALDIDNFHGINAQYGRERGDKILREIANHLRDDFRLEDVVARWGGDEFLIGLYGTNRDLGYTCITKALADLEKLGITFSGGVAEFPDDGQTIELLYQAASSAMRVAANLGGNAIVRNS